MSELSGLSSLLSEPPSAGARLHRSRERASVSGKVELHDFGGLVAHPEADTSPTLSLLMAGGAAVFLLPQAWYSWALPGVLSWLHLGAAAALATAGFAVPLLPAYTAIGVLNTLLILLGAMDARSIDYGRAKSG